MRDSKLHKLFSDFVYEIYPLLEPLLDKKWIKPKYDKYPSLKYKANGMPEMSEYTPDAPYKISDLFLSWNGSPDIDLKQYDSYNILSSYLETHKEYKDCIYPNHIDKETADNIYSSFYPIVIKDLLERYYLLNKDKINPNLELFDSIYHEFENYIYAENLQFDISIPLLFLNFEIDQFEVNDNVYIRRIGDEYHKARYRIKSYSPPIADALICSATHELVFKNYYVKKLNKFYSNSFSNENAYPILNFELFFNAIKIITNQNSGFAQILIYPHNWSRFYNADLPELSGTSTRRYPNYFDDFYWNNDTFYIIKKEELQHISDVYNKILLAQNNKIHIANKRLRYSYLRDDEEDSILDIIIALETLLSDNEKGEITHKLSLRIAKLISHFNNDYSAIEIFEAMKKVYAYRSAIVHGSNKIESKKEIKLPKESKSIKTISIANNYLREVIRILIDNPQFLDAKEIDRLLLGDQAL